MRVDHLLQWRFGKLCSKRYQIDGSGRVAHAAKLSVRGIVEVFVDGLRCHREYDLPTRV